MRKKVFVGNLNFRATEPQLAKFLEPAGAIHEVRIARGPDGRSRGFAIVEFDSDEHAEMAIEVFDGRPHLGRPLTVRRYQDVSQRPQIPAAEPGGFDVRLPDEPLQTRRVAAGELHGKADQSWRRLRGTKRRI
jgi:RNA recognition motif-containing protein